MIDPDENKIGSYNMEPQKYFFHSSQIRIRDPFVVPCKETKTYYLFGTTDSEPWYGAGEGFKVYESRDLEYWSEPKYAFQPPKGFWGTYQFWAPEVHFYRGSWYMFASFNAPGHRRGSQILHADALTGPYRPISDGPVTPCDWECLDATLFVEEDGSPWVVFSHEWLQIGNGAICAAPLSEDLTHTTAAPIVLFHAKDAPWSAPNTGAKTASVGENYVTDGPFVYRSADGGLRMLWSSFSEKGYALGIAESRSGSILGPWTQQEKPRFDFGGHGMIFKDFSGKTWLALHAPDTEFLERLTLVEFDDV